MEFPLTGRIRPADCCTHGRVIPNHPLRPAHLRNTKPDPKNAVRRAARRRKRCQATEKKGRALHAPLLEAPIPA